MSIRKLILVFKTHFDIGFTDLASHVLEQYRSSMLDRVLETCRATEHMGAQHYVWSMPAWPLYRIVQDTDEDRRRGLEHFIACGQIAWHALAFTSHTDICGEEEYLESLRYGKRLSERYGKPVPIAAKMTDVPGHGRMLPEILGASGIRFLHLGCNAFATPPDVPPLFFWEAPSGRRVLTMYSRGGYGSGLQAPQGWPFPVWMALMNTADNSGPQSAEDLVRLIEKARALYPEAEIVCGTMDDFARGLEKEDLSGLPVVTEDLADTWIHGIGAYPNEIGQARRLRKLSCGLQKYAACALLAGIPHEAPDTDAYYENMHLFGEHTFGADVKTFLGPRREYEKEAFLKARLQADHLFMEQSWDEQRSRLKNCEDALGGCQETAGNFLFNPSSSAFRGWVPCEQGSVRIFGKKSVFVPELSPLSCMPVSDAAPALSPALTLGHSRDGAFVQNHRYRLDFLPDSGRILRLSDRRTGRVLLKETADCGVFSYRYHRIGTQRMTDFLRAYGYRFPAWGVQDYGRENYPECEDETCAPAFESFRLDGSSILFSFRGGRSAEEYGDAQRMELEVTLPPEGEECFVQLTLTGKQETPYIESGCLSMPLAFENPRYLINKNGSLLDPACGIARDANHVYYALEHLSGARSGTEGIAVLPLDTPLLSLGEDGCYRYLHAYRESDPVLCFNLFNNMWGTNFPQWIGGDLTFRWILLGYEEQEEASLLEKSGVLAQGLLQVGSPVPPLPLVLPRGMELLNIRKDGDGFLLITCDRSGTERLDTVRFPGFSLCETDYYGRLSGDAQEGQLDFFRRKYGLHLFRAVKSAVG